MRQLKIYKNLFSINNFSYKKYFLKFVFNFYNFLHKKNILKLFKFVFI